MLAIRVIALGFKTRSTHTTTKPLQVAAMTFVVVSSFSGAWYQVLRHVSILFVERREEGGERVLLGM